MIISEINNLFTDDPVELANIDGRRFILKGVSFGNMIRIASIADSITSAMKSDMQPYELGLLLSDIAKIIAIACHNQKELPPKSDSEMLLDALPVSHLSAAMVQVVKKIDISPLYSHYGFKPNKPTKSYPGSNSPWAQILNMAIATKGWTEHALKWEMSFANVIMYSLCMPSYDIKEGGNAAEIAPVDMFEYFEKIDK